MSRAALHIVSHLSRIDSNGSIEISEQDNQCSKDEIIPERGMIPEGCQNTCRGCGFREKLSNRSRNKHDRLGENDRHYTRCINL
jgi:hypothetical protein